jgi:Glycosyltransferases involved in cell wall biogenesis
MHDVVTAVLSPSRSMTGISFRGLFFSWTIVIRVFLNSICFLQSRPFFATSSLLLATSSGPRTTRRAFTKPSSSWSSSTITSSNPSSIRLPPLPSFSRSVHCATVSDDEKNTTRWPVSTGSDSTCSTTNTSPDACQQLQELQHHPGEDGDYIQLTLLLPAYNEEFRIRPTLFNYTNYLLSSFGRSRGGRCGQNSTSGSNSSGATTFFSMEILVVNDGSTDNTVKVVEECKNWLLEQRQQQQQQQQTGTLVLTSIDCLTLVENQGKGSAISKGLEYIDKNRQSKKRVATTTTTTTTTPAATTTTTMSQLGQDNDTLHSWMVPSAVSPQCRQWVLVVDADGSGDITYLDAMLLKFLEFLQNPVSKKEEEKPTQERQEEWGMLIGNRIDGSASPSRSITRWGFQTIVRWICGDLGVKDTQCGMKVMTLDAGLATYSHLHLKRWTHDVEVLYRARELGIPVTEMDVGWEDKDGSKLTTSWVQTIWVSGVMLLEIVMMRVQYMLGRWKVGNVEMEERVK